MKKEMRWYQKEAHSVATTEIFTDNCKGLISMPTGTGKTFLMTNIGKTFHKQKKQQILVLAHRNILIEQIQCAFSEMGMSTHIVKQNDPSKDVQVNIALVQSMSRHERFGLISPGLVMIDEAHRSLANTYQNAFNYGCPVVGFTATPIRTEEREMPEFQNLWQKVLYHYSLKDAIMDGYLSDIRYFVANLNMDWKHVSEDSRRELIYNKYMEANGGKSIMRCATKDHANAMANYLRSMGIPSDVITDETHDAMRNKILDEFQNADMNSNIILCYVGILGEGWDCPSLKSVIFAAKIKSTIDYMQTIGRVTRLFQNKKHGQVIDVIDNYKNVDMCTCMETAFSIPVDVAHVKQDGFSIRELSEMSPNELRNVFEFQEDIDAANLELKLKNILFAMPAAFIKSSLKWTTLKTGHEYILRLSEKDYFRVKDGVNKYHLYFKEKYLSGTPDVQLLINYVADQCNKFYSKTRYMWDTTLVTNKMATEEQLEYIKRIKGLTKKERERLTYEEADQLIAHHKNNKDCKPPSQKQLNLIKYIMGLAHANPKTAKEARAIIVANRWRLKK